jgi:hypothetical protein
VTKTLADLGVTSAEEIRFIAQAVSGSNLVGLATNGGAYYIPAIPTTTVATPKTSTRLTVTSTTTSATYRSQPTFTAMLEERVGDAWSPLPGKRVAFTIGGQRAFAVTDALGVATAGVATAQLTLLQIPRAYTLAAGFDEDATHLGTSSGVQFRVDPRPTTLTFSSPIAFATGGRWTNVVTLDMGGIEFEQQTVFMVLTGTSGAAAGQTFVTSGLTSQSGGVTLASTFPDGTYTATAYFAKVVPIGTGSYDARNPRYLDSSATATLVVARTAAPSYTGTTVVEIRKPILLTATVQDGGVGQGDLDLARVRYIVTKDGVTAHDSGPDGVARGTDSNWLDSIPGGLAAGVYAVHTSLVGGHYTGAGLTAYISVYDPNGGFVTGGGWIESPAGAYAPEPELTGRATFGFVSKYAKGSTNVTGNTQFQFRAADITFKSSAHESMSLVIAGAKARYKGTGTVNGSGSYGFMLTAIDGQVSGGGGLDKFRIKIWELASGAVVYDNQMGATEDAVPSTVLGGGSVVIHQP